MRGPDVVLKDFIEKKPEEKILPPRLPSKPLKVESIKSTTIKIVKDDDVKEDEMPPKVENLGDAKIDLINRDGIRNDDFVAPPANYEGKGIIETPRKEVTNYDSLFISVEIESSFPGGPGAWMRYLNKTFRYPQEAQDDGIQGTVEVQFIVDKDGNVSEVEAMSGPDTGGLRDEAIRVIRKSGKWEPAIQNGSKVKSQKRQPITFRLETE